MLACMVLACASGCSILLPDVSHEPVLHNPFPQLNKVAVAPFFNQSDDRTVDGRRFALAYFAELQTIPGFEVVPVGVVEEAMIDNQIDLSQPGEARRLAVILGVDALVIGAITDYSPYYPPRCGLRVEWYAANPGFHEIPPGYGLPWGTPEEEFIPEPLVFESEFALAKAQLATQTPACGVQSTAPPAMPPQQAPPMSPMGPPIVPPAPNASEQKGNGSDAGHAAESDEAGAVALSAGAKNRYQDEQVAQADFEETIRVEELPADASSAEMPLPPLQSEMAVPVGTTGAIGAPIALPPGWPDERGFIPPPPSPVRPPCCPTNGPIMTHTRIYSGTDGDFTEALASYYHFRDDARFGGWQNYLSRSDDFIRFCCHLHLSEMLSARGGASETRVVWSWSDCR
jgi:hypothetical protein